MKIFGRDFTYELLHFLMGIILLTSCNTIGNTAKNNTRNPPAITTAGYQQTFYNGSPQPIEVKAVGEGAPLIITYFPSPEALEQNEGGTAEAPIAVGIYFVRIEGLSETVEYRILKGVVEIIAAEKQEAAYDGSPKRIEVRPEPPVLLTISYYPTREARDTTALPNTEAPRKAAALRGLSRIDSAPKEPGTYYVAVSFAGNENYEPVSKDVEFVIKR
ncbi:hypothetical protein FACS189498_1490 [Spirochaetia bacterium]|nr:hypothetical protein FACS189498_1490 [Spirochaetia bacterium]